MSLCRRLCGWFLSPSWGDVRYKQFLEFMKFQKAAGSGSACSSSGPMSAPAALVPANPLVADKKDITHAASSGEAGDDSSSSKSGAIPEPMVPFNDNVPAWFNTAAQSSGDPAPPPPVTSGVLCPTSLPPLSLKDQKKKKI